MAFLSSIRKKAPKRSEKLLNSVKKNIFFFIYEMFHSQIETLSEDFLLYCGGKCSSALKGKRSLIIPTLHSAFHTCFSKSFIDDISIIFPIVQKWKVSWRWRPVAEPGIKNPGLLSRRLCPLSPEISLCSSPWYIKATPLFDMPVCVLRLVTIF